MDSFEDFFAVHGQRCILLYYQEADVPVTGLLPYNITNIGLMLFHYS